MVPETLSHYLKIRQGSVTPDSRPCYHTPVSHVCVENTKKLVEMTAGELAGKQGG